MCFWEVVQSWRRHFVTGSTFFPHPLARLSRFALGRLALAGLKHSFFLAFIFFLLFSFYFFSFLSPFCFSCYNKKIFRVYNTIFDRFLVIHRNKAPPANFLIFDTNDFCLEYRWRPWLNRQQSELFRIFFAFARIQTSRTKFRQTRFYEIDFFGASRQRNIKVLPVVLFVLPAAPALISSYSDTRYVWLLYTEKY